MNPANPIARLLRLPAPERRVVLAACAALPIAAAALAMVDFRRILAALPLPPRHARTPDVPAARVVSLIAAVAGDMAWQPTCLQRSLVAAWLLGKAGCACTLVVGLRHPGDRPLDAHAWIEVEGEPVESLPEGTWTRLVRWPAMLAS